jgi:hypothetical protein
MECLQDVSSIMFPLRTLVVYYLASNVPLFLQ